MLPYTVALRRISNPLAQPLSGLASVRKVRDRVQQELQQHQDQIMEGQSRIDRLLESARRHSEAQPVLIHEPLEQAIDWLEDLQAKVGAHLVPNVPEQNPWCRSVDQRLKGLAQVKPIAQRSLQQNLQAIWQSQLAQTIAGQPNLNELTEQAPKVLAQALPQLSNPIAKVIDLPKQLRDTKARVQRQVDRFMGVRPADELWETQFPEDQDPIE